MECHRWGQVVGVPGGSPGVVRFWRAVSWLSVYEAVMELVKAVRRACFRRFSRVGQCSCCCMASTHADLLQFCFTHLTARLWAFFQCLDIVGSEWIPDRGDILKHRSHKCFVCCVFESFICSFVKRQDTNVYVMVNALEMRLIPCAHYTAAQRKKAVAEDWRFYGHFTLKSGSLLGSFTVRMCNKLLTQWVFVVCYREIWNTRVFCRSQVVKTRWLRQNLKQRVFHISSSSRLAGYDKTYTTRVSYFAVSHSDPLCKLYISTSTETALHKPISANQCRPI